MIAVMIAGAVRDDRVAVRHPLPHHVLPQPGKGQPILGKEDRGPDTTCTSRARRRWAASPSSSPRSSAGWSPTSARPGRSPTRRLIVWVGILVMSCMGFLDDYIKVSKAHNRGIFWKKKSYITLAISMRIAWWLVAATGISETISFTRYNWPGWHVPWPVWVVFAGLIIWARSTRSTSPTASTGWPPASALLGFLAFTIIAYWAFRNPRSMAYARRRCRQPARPRRARRRVRRGVRRVPVVQRRAGADHHG